MDVSNTYVVGLDTSLTGTGLASVDLTSGAWGLALIESTGHKRDNIDKRWRRLAGIQVKVAHAVDVLGQTKLVSMVGIEGPSYNSKFGSPWDRGGLWWMCIDKLRSDGIPVALVPPTSRAKYATGNGRAGKDEVMASAIRRYPTAEITNNNVADAVLIAAMIARGIGYPVDELPKKNLEAMGGIEWP